MSYREKSILVSIVTSLAVLATYLSYMCDQFTAGELAGLAGAEASMLVGQSILGLIVASIVVAIVVQILFAIANTIVTREEADYASDERDKQIELKGMQVFLISFSIGYVGAMAALAIGTAPHIVFVLITASMFAGSAIGDVTKLFFYRRGF